MHRTYAKSVFLVFWLLASLYACDYDFSIGSGSTKAETGITVFIGQVYPSQHVVLQPVLDNAIEFDEWPDTIKFYPTHASVHSKYTNALQAKMMSKISSTYVPAMEGMRDLEPSKCTQDNYRPNNYQYLLQDELSMQDYFARGMPDNCVEEDDGAVYRTDSSVTASFPVIAVSADESLDLSFGNAGKLRPLSADEKRQVADYIKGFKAEFKESYGSEYDEDTSHIGEIPTLASARILLEAQFAKAGYTIRVSSWERISVAYHVYRIIEVSLLKNGEVIESRQVSRYQGVLG